MDEALLKSGQYPNIAIEAGTDPAEVMREHGQVIQNGEKDKLTDTREKLEADVRGYYSHTVSTLVWPPDKNKSTDVLMVPEDTVLSRLDRQASITAASFDCNACADSVKRRISDMQAKVAELKAEVEKQRQRANEAERGALSDEWYVARDRYEDDIAELTAERDQLSRDLDAEHALVVQFEHDNEELRDTCNTLRASVAGLKSTVEKLKDRMQPDGCDGCKLVDTLHKRNENQRATIEKMREGFDATMYDLEQALDAARAHGL